MLRRLLTVLTAAFALSACAQHIDGIRYVSIAPAEPDPHLIPRAMWQNGRSFQVLKLRFASDIDLRAYVDRNDIVANTADVTLCPYDENRRVGAWPIYHDGIELGTRPEDSPDPPARDPVRAGSDVPAKTPFVYDTYFLYGRVSHFDETAHQVVSRPIGAAQDLCFQIGGVIYPYWRLTSNIAVIPQADLARALSKASP